ncbi:hypothetical protein GQ55_4G037800 [Panicum hallii var. hallii]|uniref:Uncharacterized protein n=1 Tax=Panicum hallii var. hallii TaxID=1504633 RepID=A0A2T7DUY1_9POAL|nr:hypothetical protein GQ55_4G037800 [Panicum hallii var. hallii]
MLKHIQIDHNQVKTQQHALACLKFLYHCMVRHGPKDYYCQQCSTFICRLDPCCMCMLRHGHDDPPAYETDNKCIAE